MDARSIKLESLLENCREDVLLESCYCIWNACVVTTLKNYVDRLKDESTETTLFKGIPVPKVVRLGGRTTLLSRTEAQLAEWLLSTLLRQFQDASAHGLEVVWTESSRKHSGELIC